MHLQERSSSIELCSFSTTYFWNLKPGQVVVHGFSCLRAHTAYDMRSAGSGRRSGVQINQEPASCKARTSIWPHEKPGRSLQSKTARNPQEDHLFQIRKFVQSCTLLGAIQK